MNIEVTAEPGTPDRTRRALSSLAEVTITDGPGARISVGENSRPFVLLPRPQTSSDLDQAARDLVGLVPRGAVGLVIAPSMPRGERDALDQAGLSWCDGRGALHLSWPGVLVHVDHVPRRPVRRDDTDRSTGLGPVGIRALQIILANEGTDWTVAQLARQAAISVGQAHNALHALEDQQLIATVGKGPRQRRHITDYRTALDWLATIDRARRRPARASTYLYARTHDEMLHRFATRAAEVGLPYAVTAAAGSDLLGVPVLNNIVVTHVRVGVLGAAAALERLGFEHLDAEDAGRGSNLEIWTDTGELGTFGAAAARGIRVAPAIRVWLDLARLGGRHEDAAQLFRAQVLERA